MKVHVLPGDAIIEEFSKIGLEGEVVICREALVEGPVDADKLLELWRQREEFFAAVYPDPETSYGKQVVAELGKLIELPAGSVVNLWFEYELFCHVNLWFCLYLLRDTPAEVYRVAPIVRGSREIWKGFGGLDAEPLRECFDERVKLGLQDVALGSELWQAYRCGDRNRLRLLAAASSENAFPFLREVCEAAEVKDSGPKGILSEILAAGLSDFDQVFQAFSDRAGIYGYGDAQVRRILATL